MHLWVPVGFAFVVHFTEPGSTCSGLSRASKLTEWFCAQAKLNGKSFPLYGYPLSSAADCFEPLRDSKCSGPRVTY